MMDREPWMDEGICSILPLPKDWFFKRRYEVIGKIICNRCPVKSECLEFAVREHMEAGLWGGVGERERKRCYTVTT